MGTLSCASIQATSQSLDTRRVDLVGRETGVWEGQAVDGVQPRHLVEDDEPGLLGDIADVCAEGLAG